MIIPWKTEVSASLLTFISNLFAQLHSNSIEFGGKNVIIVGDLAQLQQSQRQQSDPNFYKLLEVRLGKVSVHLWNLVTQKASQYMQQQSLDILLTSTHIVGLETADQINRTICNALPIENEKLFLSKVTDIIEGVQVSSEETQPEFKLKTNLPTHVRLQQGARVMFLNNSLTSIGICNGTIRVVTDLDKNAQSVQVAFCIRGAIIHKDITKQTQCFYTNGQRASRTQFPVQNSFSLTVHKTQGLTLPKFPLP